MEIFHFENRSISNQTEQWERFSQNQNLVPIDNNDKMIFQGISNVNEKIAQKNIAIEHKLKRLNQKQIAASGDF